MRTDPPFSSEHIRVPDTGKDAGDLEKYEVTITYDPSTFVFFCRWWVEVKDLHLDKSIGSSFAMTRWTARKRAKGFIKHEQKMRNRKETYLLDGRGSRLEF